MRRVPAFLPVLLVVIPLLWWMAGPGAVWAHASVEPATGESAWQALYWNNTALAGPPVLRRPEGAIAHTWGFGSPGPAVNPDHFSARWTRVMELAPGRYRLSITGDDGVRVFVDGQLVLNGWWDHGVRTFRTELDLGGRHEFRVEFYERTGWATVRFELQPVRRAPTPTPRPRPAPAPEGQEDPAWRGEYFANMELRGTPVRIRQDPAIDFDWGTGSPDPAVPADRFSVRWTRRIRIDQTGRYKFITVTDDGVRLYVDGRKIIDQWRLMSPTRHEAQVWLEAGIHEVVMEYFENDTFAVARLSIQPGEPFLDVGNLITCVPPNPPNDAWIVIYRRDVSTGQWYRVTPRGIGAIRADGYLKVDGLPVDVYTYGGRGEPYWIERYIDGRLADSIGNVDRGEPEFRIRASADNYTPWPCPR